MHPFAYSLAYNGSYIGAEAVITLILISIPAVHKALNRVRLMANEEEVRDALAQN
jgi:thiamine transporter